MFLFHRLSDGNGTNPFRLPPCPSVMPPQVPACPPPDDVTVTFTAPELALPGFGLVTNTGIVPAAEAVPDAVSWVADTNVVVIAFPPNETCAPLTKLLPVSVRLKEPVAKEVGATLLRTGTGFSSVTTIENVALESAALTAFTVTVFGLGSALGAW